MRAVAPSFALAAAAGPAAPRGNPIGGTFANPGGCQRPSGATQTTDEVAILRSGGLEFHDSFCPITRLGVSDGALTRIEAACSGEGERWTVVYAAEPLPAGAGHVLVPERFPDVRIELRKCAP